MNWDVTGASKQAVQQPGGEPGSKFMHAVKQASRQVISLVGKQRGKKAERWLDGQVRLQTHTGPNKQTRKYAFMQTRRETLK